MKKILLVEDDFALAMGTTYTLKAEGYEVLHAKTLAEARDSLQSDGISIIYIGFPELMSCAITYKRISFFTAEIE